MNLAWLRRTTAVLALAFPVSAYAEPPATKYLPPGSACFIVDDADTPARETELVIVGVQSALTATVRLDACITEHTVSEACRAKLIACRSQLQEASEPRGMSTGARIGLIAGVVAAAFFAGVAVGVSR